MKRRLFAILWALSLLLFVAILALWADTGYLLGPRGHRAARFRTSPDHPPLPPAQDEYVVGVDSRQLHLGRDHHSGTSVPCPRMSANRIATPAEILAWQNSFGPSSGWYWKGFRWWSAPMIGTAAGGQLEMLGWQSHLSIPHWALLLVFAILPAWHLLSWRRRRGQARRRRGHCPTCDYDLRASKDRCPECGTAITLAPSQQTDARIA